MNKFDNNEAAPGGEQFEDFDPTQPETEEAPLGGIESLGGLSTREDDLKSLMQAQAELETRLLLAVDDVQAAAAEDGVGGLGNIVGLGIGEKEINGHPTGQLAIKVFVKEKLSARDISSEALVPDALGGLQTDVEETREIYANMFTARYRPAPGGVSIGRCDLIMAGTFGCLVTKANQLYILSNNHVLAAVNKLPLGMQIPQPGRLDGGKCPADVIAKLTQFIPITFNNQCNYVDAAIAQTSAALTDRRILRPLGVRQRLIAPEVAPVLSQQVQKSGRTTQYTRGVVSAVNVTVNVSYAPQGGVARFCNQFQVRGLNGKPFSDRGDSGSLVTDYPGNHPVGLLFAGNAAANVTFCNEIRRVRDALGVTIVY